MGVDAAEPHLLEAGDVEGRGGVALADGHEHADALGPQPPGDEQQRLARRAVEPVRAVNEHEDRTLLGGQAEQAEQAEQRHRDGEAVVRRRRPERERRAQRRALHRRQLADEPEQRLQQREQPGVRDLRLALEAAHGQDAHVARRGGQRVEQRGLADARLAAQDDGERGPLGRTGEALAELAELRRAALEVHAAASGRTRGSWPRRCSSSSLTSSSGRSRSARSAASMPSVTRSVRARANAWRDHASASSGASATA